MWLRNFLNKSKILETECFAMIETIDLDLKCSPNNYLWFKDNYVIQDYPLCSSWCSSWYASCKHVRVCTDSPYPQGGSCPSGNDTCPTFQDIIKIDDSWDDVVTARRFCEDFFDLYAVSVINEGGLLPDPCINPNNPASVIAIINTKNMELASRNETIPLFHCESTGLDWWEIILVILGLLLVIGSIGGCIYYFCVVRKKNKNDTYDINSIEVNNKDVLNTNAAADISYVQPVDNTLYVQPGDDSLYVQPVDNSIYVQPVDDTYQRVTLERANNATLVGSSGNQTSQYGDPNQALQMSYMQNSMAQSQSQRNPAYLDSDYV